MGSGGDNTFRQGLEVGNIQFCTGYTDEVKDPDHYAGHYPFEVFQAIELLLNTFAADMKPYEIYQLGNELKYRLRAGWKDDGNNGMKDLKKAIRCNEMRNE